MHAKKAALLVAIAALWAPCAARASTYCVGQGSDSCANGMIREPSLQAALDAASTDLPGPNTIRIWAGTFDGLSAGFRYSEPSAPAVNIIGASPGVTTLTSNSAAAVLSVAANGSTIRDLTIAPSDTAAAGLDLGPGVTAVSVPVEGSGSLSGSVGVALHGAANYVGGSVSMPDASAAAVEQVDGAGGLVADSKLSAGTGLLAAADTGATITGRELTISGADGVARALHGGSIALATVLGAVHRDDAVALEADDGSLTGSGLTLVATTTAASAGLVSSTVAGGASMDLQAIVAQGFSSGFTRAVSDAGTTADLSLAFSDVHLDHDSGVAGTLTTDHLIDEDPHFVSPTTGDYELMAGSPAIDTGGPCDLACTRRPDLRGAVVPADGDGDGTATRDMGAFEYTRTPPTIHWGSTQSTVVAGQTVSFDASGTTDPDPGDTFTLRWAFGDHAVASGPVATHVYTAPGRYPVTLTATDSGGATTQEQRSIVVLAQPGGGHGAPKALRPGVSGLRFDPSRFAVAPTTARTHDASGNAKRSRVPVATRIRMTLSAAGAVTIALERRIGGHRVGRRCRGGHEHGRACTILESAGVITRTGLAAGRVSVPFTGRVGTHALARGKYVATVIVTDRRGTRSRPVTAPFEIVAART